ncbi:universal stress protein [Paraburkholderia graminis]|jgi:nucleotide-binding universal stress UspA family protein|uniref:Nucleotide-binding universal stress UspA family protein n=1 Tax=Paraburkholderia graminis TaxID=60548 RepID=A0ABD5CIK5_9BURK|nr:universal stress protein [Paraburkholderia graminis]MDR6204813.1 nucleotide-binding universal stress UspA family protein [Paraburkholderia graminis]
MSAFNRILLCYDGTREGQHALADGARLAQELAAQVHVLSVIDNSAWVQGADITSAIPVDMINDSVKSVLDEGLKKLAAKGIHATGHFAIGDPLDQIPYFAKELNVDLIVVGHHRAGRLARWWGGRTDGLLLDRVSCSVLVTMGPETESAAESAAESASESRGAASPGETTSPVEHS